MVLGSTPDFTVGPRARNNPIFVSSRCKMILGACIPLIDWLPSQITDTIISNLAASNTNIWWKIEKNHWNYFVQGLKLTPSSQSCAFTHIHFPKFSYAELNHNTANAGADYTFLPTSTEINVGGVGRIEGGLLSCGPLAGYSGLAPLPYLFLFLIIYPPDKVSSGIQM